mmetsp:Transcript_28531/g.88774  ORF Transcript_28531/g.88774 Transcript_28531/m.88774 type:complete len:308 (+) Transcript_28531:252-1175(+)
MEAALDAVLLDPSTLPAPYLAEVLNLPTEDLVGPVEHEDGGQVFQRPLRVHRGHRRRVVMQLSAGPAREHVDHVRRQVVVLRVVQGGVAEAGGLALASQVRPRRHEQHTPRRRELALLHGHKQRGCQAATGRLSTEEDLGVGVVIHQVAVCGEGVLQCPVQRELGRPSVVRHAERSAQAPCHRSRDSPQGARLAEHVGASVQVEHDAREVGWRRLPRAGRRNGGGPRGGVVRLPRPLVGHHPLHAHAPPARAVEHLVAEAHAVDEEGGHCGVAHEAQGAHAPRRHVGARSHGPRDEAIEALVRLATA